MLYLTPRRLPSLVVHPVNAHMPPDEAYSIFIERSLGVRRISRFDGSRSVHMMRT